MRIRAKKASCLSPNKAALSTAKVRERCGGYALIIIMMMAVFLLISLSVAIPSIYQEGQREKEKELIFNGEQYARAIYLFNQQFHRYPTSVKELLHTNDLSFLRRAFPDPMDRKGKWRFIHAAGNGVVVDSETLGSNKPKIPGASPGSLFSSPVGGEPEQTAESGNPSANESESSAGGGKLKGAFIVGVASTSHQRSIRVFNGHHHYNKWEFLGIPGVAGSVVPSAPGQGPVPGQPFGGPTRPTPTSPFGNPMGSRGGTRDK